MNTSQVNFDEPSENNATGNVYCCFFFRDK